MLARLTAVAAVMVFTVFMVMGVSSVAHAEGDVAVQGDQLSQEAASNTTSENAEMSEIPEAQVASYETTTAEGIKVLVDAPKGSLPEDAALSALLITDDAENDAVAAELDEAEVSYDGFVALDVYFSDADGNELEPTEAVNARLDLPEGTVPEGAEGIAVHHLAEAEDGTVAEVEAVADDADATEGSVAVQDDSTVTAEFSVSDFSVFAVAWGANLEQSSSIENNGEDEAENTLSAGINTLADGEGSYLLTETFTGSTLNGNWTLLGDAGLTAAGHGDDQYQCKDVTGVSEYVGANAGPGYLLLTADSDETSGTALYNEELQSRLGLDISFYQWQFDTGRYGHEDHADGISFFLVDGDYELTEPGPTGGGLGYSAVSDANGTQSGIPGGVLGIGLDVFGTFSCTDQAGGSDAHYCEEHVSDEGRLSDHNYSVTVRGEGTGENFTTGYKRLATEQLDDHSYLETDAPTREWGQNVDGHANGVLVNIRIGTPEDVNGETKQHLTVTLTKANGDQVVPINIYIDQLPDSVKFGFSASTGLYRDAHFIRGLEAKTVAPVESDILMTKLVTDEKPVYNAGEEVEYRFLVQNVGGSDLHGVRIEDLHIQNVTLNGENVGAGATGFDLKVGEQVTCVGTYVLTNDDIVTSEGSSTGTFTNTATAKGTDKEGKEVTSTDSATVNAAKVEQLGDPVAHKRIGRNDDGTYTLALDIEGKQVSGGAITITQPLDIVLVLDDSGSMDDMITVDSTEMDTSQTYFAWINRRNQEIEYNENLQEWGYYRNGRWNEVNLDTLEEIYQRKTQALKTAVNAFIDQAAATNDSINDEADKIRIAVVPYAGDIENVREFTYCEGSGVSQLKWTVSTLNGSGSTRADLGMEQAANYVSNSDRPDAKKVVILFTDGEPNDDSGFVNWVAADTVKSAGTIKNAGGSVYTVGVFESANPDQDPTQDGTSKFNRYMQAVSSNYPSATAIRNSFQVTWGDDGSYTNGYYKTASDAGQLSSVFEDIFESETSTNGYSNVVITDTLSAYAQMVAEDSIQVGQNAISVGGVTYYEITGGVEENKIRVVTGTGDEETELTSDAYTLYWSDTARSIRVEFNGMLADDVIYTLKFDVVPSDAAYNEFAESGYPEGVFGEDGTDLYSVNTSSGQPGFFSNESATYEWNGESSDYAKPVLQVEHLDLENILQVTKHLDGESQLEKDEFSFTVTAVDADDQLSDEAAQFAWNSTDISKTFTNGDDASDGNASNNTGLARTGVPLTFTYRDAKDGISYSYIYEELANSNLAGFKFDDAAWKVTLTAGLDEQGKIKVSVSVFTDDDGKDDNGDYHWTGCRLESGALIANDDASATPIVYTAENSQLITIPFVNEYMGYGLTIHKFIWDDANGNGCVDENEEGKPLPNATFEVSQVSPEGDYTDSETTVDSGNAVFRGFEEDVVYEIREARVPSGYDLAEPRYFRIEDGVAYLVEKGDDGTWKKVQVDGEDSTLSTADGDASMFLIKIGNKETPDLPSSGSSGTLIMMTTGFAAIALGSVYLAWKRGLLSRN
ncbi:MAG TPA: VWA domain-containing protein [Candidatus Olsenella pullicola]|nr:VWA domain-containing protein [Candidatus Olsenella pullicola]